MLIPGLLALLLVVVLISALAKEARGDEQPTPHTLLSTIDDARISESNGWVLSKRYDDVAYTVNDSGNAPLVFALEISTGNVDGVTDLQGVTRR